MKKTIFSLLFIFISLASFSQKGNVMIIGKITNNTSDKVIITNNKGERHEVGIDKNDEARGVIQIEKGPYKMTIGQEYTNIYLKPQSSLNFTIDLDKFDESVSYTGMLAAENNALAQALLLETDPKKSIQSSFKLKEKEFLHNLQELSNQKIALFSNQHIDSDLKNEELKKTKLEGYANMFAYPSYYNYLTKDSTQKLSSEYYNFMKEIDFEDKTNFNGGNISILDHYIEFLAKEISKKETVSVPERMEILASNIKNDELRNIYLAQFYESNLTYSDNIKADADAMIAATNSTDLKKEITSFTSKLDKISEGKIAPVFSLEHAKGGEKGLTDYKGSYVYIDVWATWCGPCKKELPHYEKLKADYKGKNVKFVSVCTWDEKENWIKFMKDKNLEGEQLYVAGQENDFVNNYMIRGVPTFILIDKEGKIISRQAERPSDKAIRERLDKLLSN